MSNKVMTIKFKGMDDLEIDLLGVLKRKTPNVQRKDVIQFDSVASFRNFMTLQKIEILTLIATAEPKSVYELTKMLDRGLAPVQKDCQMLESAGFIKFEKEKGGRGSLKPKLVFDYNRIVVQLPEHPYELQFSSAS